jgi:hypothetical protein
MCPLYAITRALEPHTCTQPRHKAARAIDGLSGEWLSLHTGDTSTDAIVVRSTIIREQKREPGGVREDRFGRPKNAHQLFVQPPFVPQHPPRPVENFCSDMMTTRSLGQSDMEEQIIHLDCPADATDTLVGLDLKLKRLCHLCWGPSQTFQKDKWVFSEQFG